MKYEIDTVNYWENDAFITIDGHREYFQFKDKPSLGEALVSLIDDGKIEIV